MFELRIWDTWNLCNFPYLPVVSFISDDTYHDSVKENAKFIKIMCRYNTDNKEIKVTMEPLRKDYFSATRYVMWLSRNHVKMSRLVHNVWSIIGISRPKHLPTAEDCSDWENSIGRCTRTNGCFWSELHYDYALVISEVCCQVPSYTKVFANPV